VHIDDEKFTHRTVIPQVRLHYGPDDTYPMIGSALFRASMTSDITIWPNTNSIVSNETGNLHLRSEIEVFKTGALTRHTHSFYHVLAPKDGIEYREKYEWKFSADPRLKALANENHPGEDINQQHRGLKLVRVSTGAMMVFIINVSHIITRKTLIYCSIVSSSIRFEWNLIS
jgi:hypothetical protein